MISGRGACNSRSEPKSDIEETRGVALLDMREMGQAILTGNLGEAREHAAGFPEVEPGIVSEQPDAIGFGKDHRHGAQTSKPDLEEQEHREDGNDRNMIRSGGSR